MSLNRRSCSNCIHREGLLIQYSTGFYYCPYSGVFIEDPEYIGCRNHESSEDTPKYLSDKERRLFSFLKSVKCISLLSIPEEERGTLGRLRSLGLIYIYDSWIKTSNNGYMKIKMVKVRE